jgi:hypothetical protein|tara:strand:+ start:464 stop:979 length:516 start_codon:yes stop_codon:yes gene_type:complete
MDVTPENDNLEFRPMSNEIFRLSLTVKELVYVDDSISLLVNRDDQLQSTPLKASMPTNTIGAPMEFIRKVGMGVLSIFDSDKHSMKGEVELEVSELELMILRELAHSSVSNGDILIGLGLKRKVYKALWGDTLKQDALSAKIRNDLLSTFDNIVSKDPSATEFLGEVKKEE